MPCASIFFFYFQCKSTSSVLFTEREPHDPAKSFPLPSASVPNPPYNQQQLSFSSVYIAVIVGTPSQGRMEL